MYGELSQGYPKFIKYKLCWSGGLKVGLINGWMEIRWNDEWVDVDKTCFKGILTNAVQKLERFD